MSQNNLLMQIQSDHLGIPVLRPSMLETTALGAAIIGKLYLWIFSCHFTSASHAFQFHINIVTIDIRDGVKDEIR